MRPRARCIGQFSRAHTLNVQAIRAHHVSYLLDIPGAQAHHRNGIGLPSLEGLRTGPVEVSRGRADQGYGHIQILQGRSSSGSVKEIVNGPRSSSPGSTILIPR